MIKIKLEDVENYPDKNIPCNCDECHKDFFAKKTLVLRFVKNKSKNSYKYCSGECFQQTRRKPKIKVKCENCGNDFVKDQCNLKKYPRSFCSSRCVCVYNNSHKTKGFRRSKLEIWLESQLNKIYPNLIIHYCRNEAIKAELDIYIPSLKLAFELNGIFHYEPIYGKEKLKSTLTNDKRKFQACLENGIELCIIDVQEIHNFKPERGQKFLDIILNIINQKL